MEVRAVGRGFKVQPRKVRLVAKHVKGKHAVMALAQLRLHPSKGARMLHKVIRSAVANAMENNNLNGDALIVSRIQVDEGTRLKRIQARAMGRANRIFKRMSHITVVLEEGDVMRLPKSNAKPKPRPKFEAPKPKKESKKAEAAVAEAATQTEEVAAAPEEIEAEAPEVKEETAEETTSEKES